MTTKDFCNVLAQYQLLMRQTDELRVYLSQLKSVANQLGQQNPAIKPRSDAFIGNATYTIASINQTRAATKELIDILVDAQYFIENVPTGTSFDFHAAALVRSDGSDPIITADKRKIKDKTSILPVRLEVEDQNG